MIDVKDTLEKIYIQLDYIESILEVLYDKQFSSYGESEDKNIKKEGNVIILSVEMLKENKETLYQVINQLYNI